MRPGKTKTEEVIKVVVVLDQKDVVSIKVLMRKLCLIGNGVSERD